VVDDEEKEGANVVGLKRNSQQHTWQLELRRTTPFGTPTYLVDKYVLARVYTNTKYVPDEIEQARVDRR
jgi:hypothetical protein